MFRLSMLNVERVVDSEHARDKFVKQGYELIEEVQQQTSINDLTVNQLKELAAKKGLEVPSKIKKEELIAMIEEVE